MAPVNSATVPKDSEVLMNFQDSFHWIHSRSVKRILMVLLDTAMFTAALAMAFLLRFEFILTADSVHRIQMILPLIIPVKLAIFYFLGLYKGMWRYSSMEDFWRLAQASLLSMLLTIVVVLYVYGFTGFSRSVFFLDGILSFILTGGLRMSIRTFYAAKDTSKGMSAFSLPKRRASSRRSDRILIIGAGGSGEKMLREMFDHPQLFYHPVGFLDDDPSKQGRSIHGVPVLGGVKELTRVLESHRIGQVFISVPSATGAQMRRIVDLCKESGVTYKTMPAIGHIMNGSVSIKALRDVNYEDLLRRPPVELDTAGIEDYLKGKTVLVTGAGGSIGSELCRQLIRFEPECLLLLDAGEANLFHIQMELRHEFKFERYRTILARVQDRGIIEEIFKTHRPDVVFHAAAYKHVPLLERNPWEAAFNNVLGSRVVMEMAARYETKRFVLVSTDKAVRPTNVMGTSKRLTELIMQSFQGGRTQFMAVRFGNVVGSSGSVIPLFRRQIEQGGPVTVTHPEVTRYFMTIPEAAQLILQAGALGEGGEIFVLEMGTPVKIAEMAVDLIKLSGKEPGRDIEVVFTGLRAGEKLYEELITKGEDVTRTRHQKIMVLQYNGNWNWYGLETRDQFRAWLDKELQELYRVAATHDACEIKRKLKELVPEYTPQESECVL